MKAIQKPTARPRKHQRGRRGEHDRPPAPRAEEAELGVAVVDVGVEAVLGQLPALGAVHAAEVEAR